MAHATSQNIANLCCETNLRVYGSICRSEHLQQHPRGEGKLPLPQNEEQHPVRGEHVVLISTTMLRMMMMMVMQVRRKPHRNRHLK